MQGKGSLRNTFSNVDLASMKSGVLIFVGGLGIGAAAMFALVQESPSDENTRIEEGRSRLVVTSRDSESDSRRLGHRKNSNGTKEGGTGSGRLEELLSYCEKISESKNNRGVNYLEMMRQGAVVGTLTASEAQELLELMDAQTKEEARLNPFSKMVARLAFMRWCELDGPGALSGLMVMENEVVERDGKDDFAEVGIQAWTQADPEGARRWMEASLRKIDQLAESGGDFAVLDGPHRLMAGGDFYKFFLENYIDERGEEVWGILAQIDNKDVKGSLRDNIVESLAERENDAGKLKRLLDITKPGDFNGQREVLRKLTRQSPDEARIWTESQEPSQNRDRFVVMVASEWLERDPAKAAEWYLGQELVDGDGEQDRYSRIFGAWRQQNLEEAQVWLQSQPDTQARDTAESLAANSAVGQRNYVQAVEWVSGIQNEGLRKQAFERILRNTKKLENGEVPNALIEAAREAGFELPD